MEFKVMRTGWFGDSKTDNQIRMSKGDRTHLGIQNRAIVRVKRGDKSDLAIVQGQFRDLLPYPERVAINTMLAKRLGVGNNMVVEVMPDVTQEEIDAYTSQDNFDKRQVLGMLSLKEEGQKAKDILKSFGLFADEKKKGKGVKKDGNIQPRGRDAQQADRPREPSMG